ncbi:MAG: DUF1837 domain-containing protein, partial [Rhizobiales bacterium]|nr:DUF1837 domain-containing protein [Hyphomicrobiales bacterium]
MSSWATHFRNHYCNDAELAQLVAGTGLSNAEYLTQIKFPDIAIKPGPSTRSGDFGEILVADFVQYVMGYWCPRDGRYDNRDNRNSPTQGTDIIGFRFADVDPGDPDDELFLIESKAGLRPTNKNRLQQAIDGSIKDRVREAMWMSP